MSDTILRNPFFCLFLLFVVAGLSACSPTRQAPVTDYSAHQGGRHVGPPVPTGLPPKYGHFYTVRKGDTLYSIAWAIKQDYRNLASWNHISRPYTIYVGQRLRLFPTRATQSAKKVSPKRAPTKTARTTTASKRQAPVKSTRKRTAATKPVASPKQHTASSRSSSSKKLGPVKKWIWPTNSHRIHSRFSPANDKLGIDITGRKGDGVYAAAAGQIVYAGSGLRGYGKLIIVKHNNIYLSAYAHNSRILVTEGQYVGDGQKIAEMGNGGGGRYRLHFEIRKKGKPVNPLKYLPKR